MCVYEACVFVYVHDKLKIFAIIQLRVLVLHWSYLFLSTCSDGALDFFMPVETNFCQISAFRFSFRVF